MKSMKKIFLYCGVGITFVFLLVPVYSFSPSKHELIPAGHWVYDAITAITIETGDISFVQNAPLSIAELELYLNDINIQKLSSTGKKTYEKVIDYFYQEYPAYGNEILSFGTDAKMTPELRYVSNLDMYNENEPTVDFIKRNKLVELPLIMNLNDYGVMRMNLSVSTNYNGYHREGATINIPYPLDYFDISFPQTSYLSTGISTKDDIPFFNFQLGQNHLSVGRTETGSVLVSDTLYGANYAQMSLFTENLRYTNTPIQLESDLYLYLHRMEFRLGKKVVLGLLEGALVDQPLELRYLNPVSILHSLHPWATYKDSDGNFIWDAHAAAYFGVTFDINPWKYMRIYGLYAMNQFTLQSEIPDGAIDDTYANAIGGQFGIESFVPVYDGYIHAAVEGVYNVPWLYKGGKQDSNYPSFENSTVTIGRSDRHWIQTWIGYPYGPDTITAYAKVGYNSFDTWNFYINYRYMINGEISFDTPYPTTEEDILAQTPYGIAMSEHRLGFEGSYRILDWLTTNGRFVYVLANNAKNILNNTQQGFEVSISVSMELTPLIIK